MMSDEQLPAADPKEDHATPGGQPGDNTPDTSTETVVETPGGTTVTENTDGEGVIS